MSARTVGFWVAGSALALMVISCESATPGDVSGQVVDQRGQPVADVSIEIAGVTGLTDASGRFEVADVPSGFHRLSALAADPNGAGGFVIAFEEVDVDGDVEVGTIATSDPVVLDVTGATSRSISMAWTTFADPEPFREYRLYRGSSTALDDESGELLHIATDIAELDFDDMGDGDGVWLPANTTFTYRLYVFDNDGPIAASNILSASTVLWDTTNFEVAYELVPVAQLGAEANVAGIAAGNGCTWIASEEERGGYYVDNLVVVACRNLETGETLVRHEFDDTYDHLQGIAFDGENLWLNYGNTGTGTRRVKWIEPSSGEVLGQYGMDDGIVDLAFDGQHLLASNLWNEVQFVNPQTGGIAHSIETPFDYSTTRGLAARAGELWVSSKASNHLAVLGDDGVQIGYAIVDVFDPEWNHSSGQQLAFLADGRLAIGLDARVHVYQLEALELDPGDEPE